MCSLEFPDIEKQIHQRWKDRGLVVVGVNPARKAMGGESPATMRMFREQTGATFPFGFDDGSSYMELRSPQAISPFPLDVIIDRDGRIVYSSQRHDIEAMVETLENLLEKPSP